MLNFIFVLTLIFSPCAEAFAWDDFTNNLATDLAPLITLFGEQVTKQFLSESVGILDNIIFALAPLGILTAVVSAIRVSGSPSLRAFIGRSQEASGTAEVELLSSTSETTSELWHQGGIARVFGRPKILEVVRKEKLVDDDYDDNNSDCQAGIKLFGDACVGEDPLWKEQKSDVHSESEGYLDYTPNLSFNIGMKKLPKRHKVVVAILGTVLQTGMLILAGLTVYRYPEHFLIDDRPAETYGFPLTFSGTILVVLGMFLCAYIIDKGSNEISYHQKADQPSTIYWVQPGGQKIGDQVFESFVGVSNAQEYLRSSKCHPDNSKNNLVLWLAVIFTVIGFIAQFVGLRAMHPSVTMAQLFSTLVMAILRAALRTQRMDKARDLLEVYENQSTGQINLLMDEVTSKKERSKGKLLSRILYKVIRESDSSQRLRPNVTGLRKQVRGHEMDFLAMHLEKIDKMYICIDKTQGAEENAIVDSKVAHAIIGRARLTRLTQRDINQSWKDLEVREVATCLHSAIDGIISLLQLRLHDTDNDAHKLNWNVSVYCKMTEQELTQRYEYSLHLRGGSSSNFDLSELEAIVGLWAWSLKNHTRRSKTIMKNARIISLDLQTVKEDEAWYRIWMPRGWKPDKGYETESSSLENMGQGNTGSQYFGGSVTARNPARCSDIGALYMMTANSTIMMCAQDIFISFLMASLAVIGQMDSKTIIRPSTNTSNTFALQNSWIEDMVDIFTTKRLGSRDDAYMCIIPTLSRSSKMPQLHAGLLLAAEGGYYEAIGTLVVKGANPNETNRHSQSALHLAALNQHSKTVQALIDNEATIDMKDSAGSTSLHLAAEAGSEEVVDVLTKPENKANLNATNREDWTALHLATKNKHFNIVSLLLARRANVNAKIPDGRTVLDLAKQYGHQEIIAELENYGGIVSQEQEQEAPKSGDAQGKNQEGAFDSQDEEFAEEDTEGADEHRQVNAYEIDPRSLTRDAVIIPCHHIRIGDLILLHNRPCQVIRITTSGETGKYQYLGVDLFTKQIYEETSFITYPAPSVEVQNMLGPFLKQYDLVKVKEDGNVVAKTEMGEMKQHLRVIDQETFLPRLRESSDGSRSKIRVIVVECGGVEIVVDYKVLH